MTTGRTIVRSKDFFGRQRQMAAAHLGVVLPFKSLWETEFEMITKCQVLKLVFKMLVNIIYVFNFVK